MMHILSLGAGVQSSTLALMAAHGQVKGYPHLDAAIFADTQAEPPEVYVWLDWLVSEISRSPFPFPVYRVTAGSLTEAQLMVHVAKKGHRYTKSLIPAYIKAPDGTKGIFGRRCTADHKIRPVLKKQRELAGVPRGCKTVMVKSWVGISRDEIYRIKPSRDAWAENVWPLIDMNMRRSHCIDWMKDNGFPEPPRSACSYCPFHSDYEWRRLQESSPEEFAKCVQFERDLQNAALQSDGPAKMRGIPFLHASLIPLDQVQFEGTPGHSQLDLFSNECSGMCGV